MRPSLMLTVITYLWTFIYYRHPEQKCSSKHVSEGGVLLDERLRVLCRRGTLTVRRFI